MIKQNTQPAILHDLNFKLFIYAQQTRLKSGSTTTARSLKCPSSNNINSNKKNEENLKNMSLDKKLSASDESLMSTMSITAAVAELRPMPEILPFSVDLPIKVKMSPLVKQNSAPASTTLNQHDNDSSIIKTSNKSIEKKQEKSICKSSEFNEDAMINQLFEFECNKNKDLINDFFMMDHYLMPENKHNTQLKKQSSDILTHTRRNMNFGDWNDGIHEWYPNNPYPPFKYYLKSFHKLRTKQGMPFEFDTGLGFYIPTSKTTNAKQSTTSSVSAPKQNLVNNSNKQIGHFHVPLNVANRLERLAKQNNENDLNSPVIYPFMENSGVSLGPQSITFGKYGVPPQHMNKIVDQLKIEQRQYSNNINMGLDIRSFPSMHISDTNNNTYNNLDSLDFRSPNAESMLYSNATRMIQMRSQEIDKVKSNQGHHNVFNSNEFQKLAVTPVGEPLPLPLPHPPPPPHKQEHLNPNKNLKVHSRLHSSNDNINDKSYSEIEANRIKSYNEGANIFKINKIREFTPDFEKRQYTYLTADLKREKTELEATDKFKNRQDLVSAGCYVPNPSCYVPNNSTSDLSAGMKAQQQAEIIEQINETERKNNSIHITSKSSNNNNNGYVNYQLSKQPGNNSQTSTQNTTQSNKKTKNKKLKQNQAEIIQISSSNPPNATSVSVYNPFLIASNNQFTPVITNKKLDSNSVYSNLPGTAPPSLTKQDNINNKDGNNINNGSNSAEIGMITSLPPIISGKRIKLPLGPHRYAQSHRPTKLHMYKHDASKILN